MGAVTSQRSSRPHWTLAAAQIGARALRPSPLHSNRTYVSEQHHRNCQTSSPPAAVSSSQAMASASVQDREPPESIAPTMRIANPGPGTGGGRRSPVAT